MEKCDVCGANLALVGHLWRFYRCEHMIGMMA